MAKHVHADNIVLYGQDAQETETPWDRWQIDINGKWQDLGECFYFIPEHQYRRKPKMLSVTLANGEVVSWPEPLKEALDTDEKYWYFNMSPEDINYNFWRDSDFDKGLLSMGMLHLTKEAADQHSTALRKINTQGA